MSFNPASRSVVATSKYNGSARAPGSLVRSSTATFLAVLGRTFNKCLLDQGRYKRTLTQPTFSPFAVK